MLDQLPSNRQYRQIFTIKMPFCLAEIYLPMHCFGTERLLGRGLENIVAEVAHGNIIGYFSEADISVVGALGAQKFKDLNFFEEIKISGNKASKTLWDNCSRLERSNLNALDNESLKQEYLQQIELIRNVYAHFNLSSPAISAGLEKAIDEYFFKFENKSDLIREVKSIILSDQPKTLLDEEEAGLQVLAEEAKQDAELNQCLLEDSNQTAEKLAKNFLEFNDKLLKHQEKYGFLQGYVNFQTFSLEYYLYRLRENLSSLPTKQLSKQAAIKHLFAVVQYLSADRMNKRIDFTKGLIAFKKIINEIAERLNLDPNDVCYLRIAEVVDFLEKGLLVSKEVIGLRQNYAIWKIEDKQIQLLLGSEAKTYSEKYLPKVETAGLTQVSGATGSPGLVQGRVMVIADENDLMIKMEAMQTGDILVTGNTRPDMIAACRKAAAIVTDEGGILSHAALVSREFGIPCVIGTKIGTKVFKTGDCVEVDANKGIVRKIK